MRDRHRMRLMAGLASVVALVVAAFGLADRAAAPTSAAWIEPAACATASETTCAANASAAQGTAEEQLAAKYAPIIYLREQEDACDREAYRPSPVEITLGNPSVKLISDGPEGRVVQEGPRAADLYRLRDDKKAYLDLNGRPGEAGCTYIQEFRSANPDTLAVTYAHIAREKGYLALQYWFYYYFNDWNNQHESDWEMIQLLFDADSAAEALNQEPVRVAYAQHGGGEKAGWNDKKLRREGNHPIVYASAGSHASYFKPAVYLGLGERGSGLGCDDTSDRARRVPLEARLIPATITGEDDPFAWTLFEGRWGQREPGQNNGPLGPNNTKRWTRPVTDFDESIRDVSATVPARTTLGPNAVDLLCRVVSVSGTVLGLYYESPLAVGLTGAAFALVTGVFLVASVRADLFRSLGGGRRASGASPLASASAVSLYLHYPWLFLATGLIFIPIGLLSYLLNREFELHLGGLALLVALFGGLPLLAAFVFVNSSVAAALAAIESGRRASAYTAYRAVWSDIRRLAWARFKAGAIVSLLAVTVIGLPFALNRLVRWLFVEQAIVLDGADSKTALATSASAVRGHWWRTAALAIVLLIVGALLGPILGIVVLVAIRPPAWVANVISSLVYALVLPLVFIAMTQYYRGLRARRER